MTKIDLRDSPARTALGLRNETISQPSLFPHTSQKRKPRQERRGLDDTRKLIYDVVADCGRLSRLDICRLIHRAKTPWLVSQIEQMVKDGYLVRVATPIRADGVWKYEYEVKS